ncbi:TniQ family protein [Endozoicomonas sp. GU-1]|uniref:TniQ family protein n=1 Tax=Endozoicomonas sp. GU-1 TaxID=3009078 RepID=UPI0022B41DE6|nr:TniQ family protein [Endozoicomonas sp. GU-1]WBA82376.1 TniQ family protein [Endozoicomonas sp. GU-1]WBA85313.1 TniQ family protein [Endozoicomonas sp. GU-1]
MLLLSRPKSNKLESLRGYILRLSQANSYHTTQYVLEMADLWTGRNYDTASKYVLGDADLSKLAKITNMPLQDLESLRYGLNDQKQSIIHNHHIANEHLRLDYPRICPICLESNNMALAVWDIPAITVCPTHHIHLFDHCPECDTRLRWNRPGIHRCHNCECDYRHYTGDKILLKEYRLSRFIYQLCMNKEANNRLIPEVLRNHSLADVLELVSALALFDYQLLDDVEKTRKFLSLKSAPNHQLHEHYSNAMSYLDNWPHNFCQLLSDSRKVRRDKGANDGISKEIGAPFYLINANQERAIYQPLWEAYNAYRKQSIRQTIEDLKQKRINADQVAVRVAAKELDVRPEQLQRFCKRLKIPLKSTNSNIKLISRKHLPALKELLEKLLTISESSEKLGITVYQLRGMIRKGGIIPFRGPTVDKSRGWYFEPEAIDTLLHEINKRCLFKEYKRTHCLSLQQSIEQLSYHKIGLPEIVDAILSDQLQPASASKAPVLGDLLFSEAEVRALRPSIQSSSEYWQPLDIQKHLGCNKDIVYGLLNDDHLPMEKIHLSGRSRPVVACKKSAVMAFKNKFYLLRTLSQQTGIVSEKLRKLLKTKKINPVSGPTVDNSYCHFYRKNKAIKKALKELIPG